VERLGSLAQGLDRLQTVLVGLPWVVEDDVVEAGDPAVVDDLRRGEEMALG